VKVSDLVVWSPGPGLTAINKQRQYGLVVEMDRGFATVRWNDGALIKIYGTTLEKDSHHQVFSS
jgi:hypothetical protein